MKAENYGILLIVKHENSNASLSFDQQVDIRIIDSNLWYSFINEAITGTPPADDNHSRQISKACPNNRSSKDKHNTALRD
jgi:hypothetical protein